MSEDKTVPSSLPALENTLHENDNDGEQPAGATTVEGEETKSRGGSLEKTVRMIAAISVAVSAVVATWQFFENANNAKRERSVGFLEQWQSKGYRDAYARLSASVESVIATQPPLPSNIDQATLYMARNGLGDLTVRWLRSEQISYEGNWEKDLDSLFDFYSEVEFCLSAKLCNAEILQDYFSLNVRDFWSYFLSYSQGRREQYYPEYGLRVEALVERFEDLK